MNTKTTKTAIAAILMISFAAAAGASVGSSAGKSINTKSPVSAKAAPGHSALDAAATAPWTRATGNKIVSTAVA